MVEKLAKYGSSSWWSGKVKHSPGDICQSAYQPISLSKKDVYLHTMTYVVYYVCALFESTIPFAMYVPGIPVWIRRIVEPIVRGRFLFLLVAFFKSFPSQHQPWPPRGIEFSG